MRLVIQARPVIRALPVRLVIQAIREIPARARRVTLGLLVARETLGLRETPARARQETPAQQGPLATPARKATPEPGHRAILEPRVRLAILEHKETPEQLEPRAILGPLVHRGTRERPAAKVTPVPRAIPGRAHKGTPGLRVQLEILEHKAARVQQESQVTREPQAHKEIREQLAVLGTLGRKEILALE